MKSLVSTLTALTLAVLLFAAASPAQQTGDLIIKVDVPFEFTVGHRTYPAGTYVVARANASTLVLRDSRNYVLANLLPTPAYSASATRDAKLVFYRCQGQYFLARIWQERSHSGYELAVPKRMTALAKSEASQVQVAAGTRR